MTKIAVGLRIEERMLDRLRNAVGHFGQGLTVTSVLVAAIEEAVVDLERRNGGKPFPARRPRKARASAAPKK